MKHLVALFALVNTGAFFYTLHKGFWQIGILSLIALVACCYVHSKHAHLLEQNFRLKYHDFWRRKSDHCSIGSKTFKPHTESIHDKQHHR